MLTHSAKLPPAGRRALPSDCWPAVPAFAQDPELHLAATIDRIEEDLGARVGLMIRDSGFGLVRQDTGPTKPLLDDQHVQGPCCAAPRPGIVSTQATSTLKNG